MTEHTKLMLPRRHFLRRAAGAAGVAMGGAALGGCDALTANPEFRRMLQMAERMNYKSQRAIMGRMELAPEYRPDQMSPVFRANGNTMPTSTEYAAHLASGFADWRLKVDGLVARPLSLSLSQLMAMPQREQITRHDCVEGWSAIGKWAGPQLSRVLDSARLLPAARYIVFHCADSFDDWGAYYESVDLIDAYHPQTILAWRMNDAPVPVENGAPVRLRVERQLGYKQAKYVMRIEARDRIDNLYGGKGGLWEDRGNYEWYAGI